MAFLYHITSISMYKMVYGYLFLLTKFLNKHLIIRFNIEILFDSKLTSIQSNLEEKSWNTITKEEGFDVLVFREIRDIKGGKDH